MAPLVQIQKNFLHYLPYFRWLSAVVVFVQSNRITLFIKVAAIIAFSMDLDRLSWNFFFLNLIIQAAIAQWQNKNILSVSSNNSHPSALKVKLHTALPNVLSDANNMKDSVLLFM